MEHDSEIRPDASGEPQREPYSKPVVTSYGDVAEITKGGGIDWTDETGAADSLPF